MGSGSLEYSSPELVELLSGDKEHLDLSLYQRINSYKSDIYSLGLTFLSLLLQQRVTEPKQWNLDRAVLQGKLKEVCAINQPFSEILSQMLAHKPKERIDCVQLKQISDAKL